MPKEKDMQSKGVLCHPDRAITPTSSGTGPATGASWGAGAPQTIYHKLGLSIPDTGWGA